MPPHLTAPSEPIPRRCVATPGALQPQPVPEPVRTLRTHPAVPVLRWPEQADEVERYRSTGMPRLLLIESAARPPVCVDPLEDWVRRPVDETDLEARRAALRARATRRDPVIDDHNVIHYAGQSLPLAAGEADLTRLLLASYRSVVGREELIAGMWPPSETWRRNTLDVRVLRARRSLAPLGLVIRTVWRKGYMADALHGEAA